MIEKEPPRLKLAYIPTPVHKLQTVFDPYKIYFKRDDLTGIELSGNKVRKLEYLLKDAQDLACQRILTCGGLQSNHCRAVAFTAAKLNLKSTLFLRGSKPDFITGNYFLDLLCGADIKFVTPEEYKSINEIMHHYARKSDEKCYIIPEGGSNALGCWGYLRCFYEILDQIKISHPDLDAVFVATGSGGTHAGLLLGKLLSNSSLNIYSVNVCDSADLFKAKIKSIIYNFSQQYGYNLSVTENDIHIYDGFIGEGYALIGKAETEVIKDFARSEGMILDPVYTAKAFLGLKTLLAEQKIKERNLLFIHTGGVFGIFDKYRQFI